MTQSSNIAHKTWRRKGEFFFLTLKIDPNSIYYCNRRRREILSLHSRNIPYEMNALLFYAYECSRTWYFYHDWNHLNKELNKWGVIFWRREREGVFIYSHKYILKGTSTQRQKILKLSFFCDLCCGIANYPVDIDNPAKRGKKMGTFLNGGLPFEELVHPTSQQFSGTKKSKKKSPPLVVVKMKWMIIKITIKRKNGIVTRIPEMPDSSN